MWRYKKKEKQKVKDALRAEQNQGRVPARPPKSDSKDTKKYFPVLVVLTQTFDEACFSALELFYPGNAAVTIYSILPSFLHVLVSEIILCFSNLISFHTLNGPMSGLLLSSATLTALLILGFCLFTLSAYSWTMSSVALTSKEGNVFFSFFR